MADRLSNLDPALGGGGIQQRQYPPESPAAEPYTTGAGLQNLQQSYPSQPIPQPYYQYPSTSQNDTPRTTAPKSRAEAFLLHHLGPVQAEADAEDQATAQQPEDGKRQRACEACRGLKVRCVQNPQRPDQPCKRCWRAARQCVITVPSRKRQKKADSRVAELEKKLDALTAALEHRHTEVLAQPETNARPIDQAVMVAPQPLQAYDADHASSKRRRLDTEVSQPSELDASLASVQPGLWDQGQKTLYYEFSADDLRTKINAMLPFSRSAELFKHYNEIMTPYLPMVVFPRDTNPEQIFTEKPILYLAAIAAASAVMLPHVTITKLQAESFTAIANCVVRDGAKSLELIQAMLIMAAWYKPPERAEQTNFYQIIHMAAVMALDIGLDRRFYPRKKLTPFGNKEIGWSTKSIYTDSDALEARRAWLGCYYLCATASMVLRRPNLLRWTNYMKECIEVLETSQDAQPSDKLLCQHIKIQHICEEIGLQFLMDDSTAQVSITDPKVTYALTVLENQLKTWKQQVPEEAQCSSLTFFEHVTSLYLHEIALHFNHNVEDFRLPFTEESLKNVDNSPDVLTANQIAAIEACLKAAHGILDVMINFTVDEMMALPLLLYFVRCMYAFVILIKMHVAINTPGSELGKLMKDANLKIDFYMDSLIESLSRLKAIPSSKPDKALKILSLIRDWLKKHNDGTTQQNDATRTTQDSTDSQTPLHMLSQVATGQQAPSGVDMHTDWTLNGPGMINYSARPHPKHPDSKFPLYQQQGAAMDTMVDSVDTATTGFGWGSGFEQAMDMTLGHMGDLAGSGLDNWFLGDNMAPFGFTDNSTTG